MKKQMRLIDADKFTERCKQIISEESDNPACISWAFAYDNVIDEINEQPIVDAVPVVRCKDCSDRKICNLYLIYGEGENNFCSFGSKKEEQK